VVDWFPNIFPVTLIWLNGIWILIGGGSSTVSSLLMVLVTVRAPLEYRISAFSQVQVAILLSEMIAINISALLMRISPWIPMMSSTGLMILGAILSIFLIQDVPIVKQDRQARARRDTGKWATAEVWLAVGNAGDSNVSANYSIQNVDTLDSA
jgi:hypothetical protein